MSVLVTRWADEYAYNPAGELLSLIDKNPPDALPGSGASRATSISRDVAGRPVRVNETWNGGRDTLYRYIAGGLVDQVKVDGRLSAGSGSAYEKGSALDYGFDNLDRQTSTAVSGDGEDRVTSVSYWPSGAPRATTKANGTVESRYFASDGKLSVRSEQHAGESVPSASDSDRFFAYAYDENNNRTRDERGSYRYNARDQLTHWEHPGQATEADQRRVVDYVPNGDGAIASKTETATYSATSGGFAFDVKVESSQTNRYDGDVLKSSVIHEIHPGKFGGSPTDPANKIALTPHEHYSLNAFWMWHQRYAQGGP